MSGSETLSRNPRTIYIKNPNGIGYTTTTSASGSPVSAVIDATFCTCSNFVSEVIHFFHSVQRIIKVHYQIQVDENNIIRDVVYDLVVVQGAQTFRCIGAVVKRTSSLFFVNSLIVENFDLFLLTF